MNKGAWLTWGILDIFWKACQLVFAAVLEGFPAGQVLFICNYLDSILLTGHTAGNVAQTPSAATAYASMTSHWKRIQAPKEYTHEQSHTSPRTHAIRTLPTITILRLWIAYSVKPKGCYPFIHECLFQYTLVLHWQQGRDLSWHHMMICNGYVHIERWKSPYPIHFPQPLWEISLPV